MGKKLESNFKNMVLVLFTITLISSAAVAYVNSLTAEPIEEAKQAKQVKAIREVIPGKFDNDPMAEAWAEKTPDGGILEFYPAKKEGQLLGTAVKTYTNNGFGGTVWLMVGFNPDGTIANYSVLDHKETPGLGSKMDSWFKPTQKEKSLIERIFGFEVKSVEKQSSVIGKNPETQALAVSKDGGEVDAITAATISSRAFLDAINRAANGLKGSREQTSATSPENKNN